MDLKARVRREWTFHRSPKVFLSSLRSSSEGCCLWGGFGLATTKVLLSVFDDAILNFYVTETDETSLVSCIWTANIDPSKCQLSESCRSLLLNAHFLQFSFGRRFAFFTELDDCKNMVASTSHAEAPKSHDLTAKLLPHLDRHLVLPLLDFLESKSIYNHEEVLKAKFDLLTPTNMVTFVLGLKREIDGETDENAVVPEGEHKYTQNHASNGLTFENRVQEQGNSCFGDTERVARSSASSHGSYFKPRSCISTSTR